MRRMHGRLMERLAGAGAKAVVWDITFIEPTEFDADFVRGVEALRESGAGTVVAIDTWDVDDSARPPISPLIREARVLWGGTSIGVDAMSAWTVDLVVRHAGGTPIPSLALAALSARQQPGLDVVTLFDESRDEVELRFRALDSTVMQAVNDFRTVALSTVRQAHGDEDDRFVGLKAGSLVGLYTLEIPPDDVLAAVTRPYHEVFSMPGPELANWCRDRLVLVCDNRLVDGSGDRFEGADGRQIWGGEAHAIAINSLLRDAVAARYPRTWAYTVVIALAALAGVLAAYIRVGSPSVRALLLVFLAAAAIILSVLGYRVSGYLCHPMAPVLAMVLAFAAWRWLDRIHTGRLQ
jgi:hypothetical protein